MSRSSKRVLVVAIVIVAAIGLPVWQRDLLPAELLRVLGLGTQEQHAAEGADAKTTEDTHAHREKSEAVPPSEHTAEKQHGESDSNRHDHAVESAGAEPGGHDHAAAHAEKHLVRIDPATLSELGITVKKAAPGEIREEITLPGEVVVDPNAVAHLVPSVPGVVREVAASLGDQVQAGDLLAVLDSRELAEAHAEHLAARSRLELASATYEREHSLFKQKISAEREFLEARQARAEAGINVALARQRLQALGVSSAELEGDHRDATRDPRRYELRSPIDGIVTAMHLVRGELLRGDESAYVLSDLRTLWTYLSVPQSDLRRILSGQPVRIRPGEGGEQVQGVIDYIDPVVQEATRTARARVVLDNQGGNWRPGQFVTGVVTVATEQVAVVVPRAAVQSIEERTVVFVRSADGFEPRPVKTGRSDGEQLEIVSGLQPGESYVATGTLTVKAELGRSELEAAGHAH